MGVKSVYHRNQGQYLISNKLANNSIIITSPIYPDDPHLKRLLLFFQGRTVDLKTLTLIEEPTAGDDIDNADEEFERILRESGE